MYINYTLKIYFGRVYWLNYFRITFFLSEANIEILICEKLSSSGDASLIIERFEVSCNSGVVLQAISGSPEISDLFSCIRILIVLKISLQSMCGVVDSFIIIIQLILSIWLGTNMITLTGFYNLRKSHFKQCHWSFHSELFSLRKKFVNCQKFGSLIYIYKRLRPSKKIRSRKKKEQQKLFIKSPNLLNLTGEGGGAGRPMQGMGTPT